MIEIRKAEMNDAERLLQIYDYYVKNTAITFECRKHIRPDQYQRL